jgi:uncharacterized protein
MRGIALGFLGALALITQVSGQESPRSAQSLECSKQADARGVHGAERRDFMAQCKGSAGQPAQSPVPQQAQKPPVTPAQSANQPSFNCASAKSASARLICSDPELSNADGALGKAFQGTVRNLEGMEKAAKIEEQVKWIRERNARCQLDGKFAVPTEELQPFKPCVLDAINARIGELVRTVGPKPVAESATRILTTQECSTKYQAAKTADTLNGQKWNDFRVSQCGASPVGNTADKPLINAASNDLCQDISTNCINRCNGDAACSNACIIIFDQCRSARPDTVLNQPPATPPASANEFNNWTKTFEVNCFDVANGGRVVVYNDLSRTPIWGQRFMSGWVQLSANADFESLTDHSKLTRFVQSLYKGSVDHCRKESAMGKGEFTPNFGVILDTPPPPYGNSWAKDIWWSRDGVTVLAIEPNIVRFATDIVKQVRAQEQIQRANEQAQRDRAAQEARNADIMRTNMANFTSNTGVQQWVNREDLRSNAVRFKGQVVGIFAYFSQLESETEGIFGDSMIGPSDTLIVKGIDATKLKKNQQVIMAVRVNGLRPYSGVQVPDLTLVGTAYCKQQRCSEFGNIPN